ncbi:S-locus-specific glycoprotein BS29-2-like [Glycine max]|uniref:S-locus-specific glycoprotein BS29-2-like n=1 Tax=Glycine max TaxID=3847 RepID=UPI00023C2B7A|nr:S-locus-specific glycoprotein BS29-2-like [Glycine max]|eukprot:XP_014632223.1 S-locus-specific glycoprotein BS29-2-like [Glycine max]
MILSTCSSPRVMGRPWYQKLESLNLGFSALVVPRNKTVVWVAKTPSRFLRHLNTQQHRQSCPNNSHKQAQNPVVVLLDSGNLVIKIKGQADPEAYLWQSFDNSSDTLLPGMKLGSNLRTGLNRRYTSWKSPDDPSPGDVWVFLGFFLIHPLTPSTLWTWCVVLLNGSRIGSDIRKKSEPNSILKISS